MTSNDQPFVVLVVDDEDDLRDILIGELRHHGMLTLGASNGTEAFSVLQKQHVDIVLTDVRMPNGDGIGLFNKIRNFKPSLPVIFMSGYYDNELCKDLDREAYKVIEKPFNLKELIAVLKNSLRNDGTTK